MKTSNPLAMTLEPLEPRRLLAGNVTAAVRGGTLFIDGDELDNSIEITSVGDVFTIDGADDTTINGQAGDIFTGVTRDVRIRLKDGVDELLIDNVEIRRHLTIDMGKHNSAASTVSRLEVLNSAIDGNLSILTGSSMSGEVTCFYQQIVGNTILGQVSIRNGANHLTSQSQYVHFAVKVRVEDNVIERGLRISQGSVFVRAGGGVGATEISITDNAHIHGGVRIVARDVDAAAGFTAGNTWMIASNGEITGGISVRSGRTTVSGTRGTGNHVQVSDNGEIHGNVDVRLGNADTKSHGITSTATGNLTQVHNNGRLTGNLIIRHGNTTALAAGGAARANAVEVVNNTIDGIVNITNGIADATAQHNTLEPTIANHSVIAGNIFQRHLRITNRTGLSSAPGPGSGNVTTIGGNAIQNDVIIRDGRSAGPGSGALLSMSNTDVFGRLSYFGREGDNYVMMEMSHVRGTVSARTGAGEDSFAIETTWFDHTVRLDGGANSDGYIDAGGNAFQVGPPILLNIEIV